MINRSFVDVKRFKATSFQGRVTRVVVINGELLARVGVSDLTFNKQKLWFVYYPAGSEWQTAWFETLEEAKKFATLKSVQAWSKKVEVLEKC